MANPPEDMTALWVRDEAHDLRKRVKYGARRKGQTAADFVRRAIEYALADTDAPFANQSDRKSGQNESCNCSHEHN